MHKVLQKDVRLSTTEYLSLLKLKIRNISICVPSGPEEYAADPTVALSPLQEVRLGQEVSQLQGRMQALASDGPCYTIPLSV
jgi:hypothetical protein